MAWRPGAPAKTRRQFDAYAAERRARIHVENAALVLVLFSVRAWVLGKGRAGDVARRVGRRPA